MAKASAYHNLEYAFTWLVNSKKVKKFDSCKQDFLVNIVPLFREFLTRNCLLNVTRFCSFA